MSVCLALAVQGQIVTDRPNQTDASSTVPKGSFQIETGIGMNFTEDRPTRQSTYALPNALFRYGLANWLEARVITEFDVQQLRDTSGTVNNTGIADLQVGAKIQLFRKDSSGTEVAILSHVIVPSGSSSLSNGRVGSSSKISISHALAQWFGVGYNVGYNYLGTGSGDLTYSLSFNFSITDKLGLFAEPYGSWDNFSSSTVNFDAGFTYLIKDNLQYDFVFGTGLNNQMNFVSTGISWNIAQRDKSLN